MENVLLGIDIGTSACKIAFFNYSGKVLAQKNQVYPIYYPFKGWAEQNPEEWWEAVCVGIQKCIAEEIKPQQIKAIGIDGQSWACIPVDQKGKCLAKTPIWMDTRARDICLEVHKKVDHEEIYQIAGNDFLPSYTTPKILWFQQNEPTIYQNTYKFLQVNSFIGMKLTGVMKQDYSQGYGLHFFDVKNRCYDMPLAEKLGIDLNKIPDLCPSDKIIGTVTKEASKQTGLLEGVPVVAGGLDAACGTLGAGVYKTGQTQEQGGQAGGMSICVDRALSHPKLILSTHVVPDKWLLQGGTVGGGGAFKWFRQEFGPNNTFDDLTKMAAGVPPGSDGVIFLPFMAGERSPIWNPDAKGVYYGLSYDKTIAHLVRATLEGVAYSLEHNLRVAHETGAKIGTLSAMGGAANSILWTQIKADITGREIQVPASDTASALGAAILGGVGAGVYKNYEEAVQKTITISRVQEPNMENHKIYQERMEKYLDIVKALSPIF